MLDPHTGFLKLTKQQYAALKPLNFLIGGTTYALTPHAQIWPRELNAAIGGESGSVYLVVGDVSLLLFSLFSPIMFLPHYACL